MVFLRVAFLLLVTAAPAASAPLDLCSTCKSGVNSIVQKGVSAGCDAACAAIPGLDALCPLICPAIASVCSDKTIDCGDAVCSAISVCSSNPWEHEVVWNFTLPTYTPALSGDTIVLTSTAPSSSVPEGMVQICLKESGTWWKAVTMFMNHTYIKEVAHTQDAAGKTNCGTVEHQELNDHYFTLSKAETFGVHTNVYHILNAGDMAAQGSYLFDWQKD